MDEARERLQEQQANSKNTKVTGPEVADVLGCTAVLINDMKKRRQKGYDFTWKNALQSTGESGIKLQYSHARLHNLLTANGLDRDDFEMLENLVEETHECVSDLIEQSALELIFRIAQFDEVIRDAYVTLEPCVIVQYLFKLCGNISKCYSLSVKGAETPCQAKARLIMFAAAKTVLSEGMKLLGLQPLNEM